MHSNITAQHPHTHTHTATYTHASHRTIRYNSGTVYNRLLHILHRNHQGRRSVHNEREEGEARNAENHEELYKQRRQNEVERSEKQKYMWKSKLNHIKMKHLSSRFSLFLFRAA